MGEVVTGNFQTLLDIPVEKVCDGAKAECIKVLIIGKRADGSPYFASSTGDAGEILLMIERFKIKLLSDEFQ